MSIRDAVFATEVQRQCLSVVKVHSHLIMRGVSGNTEIESRITYTWEKIGYVEKSFGNELKFDCEITGNLQTSGRRVPRNLCWRRSKS